MFDWQIRGTHLPLGDRPRFMGIVNATPDSFSDGGRFMDVDRAVAHALELEQQGADILDIGGESTRPGATRVPLEEELRRVAPVIERLSSQTRLPISVDTYKAEVARQALLAGAHIVNDISGLQFDPAMIDVCRELSAGVIVMHIQGTPQTMQLAPRYDHVVSDVRRYFEQRIVSLTQAGIRREQIVLDPGIGFGKTAAHNIDVLANVAQFRSLGCPVLIGHSRKRFLQKMIGRPVDERLFATVGISVAMASLGVDILRVHDVAASRDAVLAWQAVMERTGTPESSS